MNPDLQEIVALVVVALAGIGLSIHWLARRKSPGCTSGCACPPRKPRS
jgi:hypothetical protein